MKAEAALFTGVAIFFAVVTTAYALGHIEPAGVAMLLISFVMAALVAVFLWSQWVRTEERPQDVKNIPVSKGAGLRNFFSPHSPYPVVTAAGVAVMGLGMVYGLWLFITGVGVLAPGVAGFVFQHNDR